MKHLNSISRQKSAFHKILVVAVAFFFLALPAHALTEGPYFTLMGSVDTYDDLALTGKISAVPSGESVGIKTGAGFNHSIGYQFKNSFSTELEFSYKGGDFDVSELSGSVNSKSFLVNGIYSFNRWCAWLYYWSKYF